MCTAGSTGQKPRVSPSPPCSACQVPVCRKWACVAMLSGNAGGARDKSSLILERRRM